MLNTGKRLAGRYEIQSTLGGGGMAVVYKATDLVLDRQVAIKVMNDSLKNNREFVQRFIREAKAAGSLSHPNVVNIFDIGREETTYYMVMEYVEGITLAEYVAKKGSLMSDEAVEIVMQVCDGLTHAHQNGIIHRDIKTQNIMRAVDGRYKVTDFGISFVSNMTSSLTQTGTVMGSAHYLSPEQASGQKVTYTSDLYAVGVLLYFLVTGRFPFDGESSVAIAVKHLQAQLPDPREFNPLISEELCNVIQKTMAKDPAERYQTAAELKLALKALLSGLTKANSQPAYHFGQSEESSSKELTLPSRHAKHKKDEVKKSYKGVWIGAAVGIILLLGSGFVYWATADEPAPPKPKKTVVKEPVRKPKPKQVDPVVKKPEIEGDHPWWKELPKDKYKNSDAFQKIQVAGKDGEYDVALLISKIPEKKFYYSIYVVDSFSSRLILKDRSVEFSVEEGADQTLKDFHVSIPEPLLPTTGVLKIEIYRITSKDKKASATDNLLQQWGEVPSEEEESDD